MVDGTCGFPIAEASSFAMEQRLIEWATPNLRTFGPGTEMTSSQGLTFPKAVGIQQWSPILSFCDCTPAKSCFTMAMASVLPDLDMRSGRADPTRADRRREVEPRGSHRHRRTGTLGAAGYLGSVSSQVVAEAPCTVTVVRAAAAAG
jgi:hypothetical protein